MLGGKWSDVRTQDKPYVCVPIGGVLSAVSQVVALQESVSRTEDKASEKHRDWKRPPSHEKGVNQCPGAYGEKDQDPLLNIYIYQQEERVSSRSSHQTYF